MLSCFCELWKRHRRRMLAGSFVPPFDRGWRWSLVSAGSVHPAFWHWPAMGMERYTGSRYAARSGRALRAWS